MFAKFADDIIQYRIRSKHIKHNFQTYPIIEIDFTLLQLYFDISVLISTDITPQLIISSAHNKCFKEAQRKLPMDFYLSLDLAVLKNHLLTQNNSLKTMHCTICTIIIFYLSCKIVGFHVPISWILTLE